MIESRDANDHFYNCVLHHFGLPPMTPQQATYAHMATSRQALEHILPQDCLDRLGPVVREHINYKRDILPRITLMPGFADFAGHMHALGLRLAVSTNRTTEGMQDVLDFFHLPAIYDPVMTASNATPKPSPEAPLAVCHAWGVEPGRVLMVGDSLSDRQAAHAAGMAFCAFGPGDLEGDIKVRDFPALRDALQPQLPASSRQ